MLKEEGAVEEDFKQDLKRDNIKGSMAIEEIKEDNLEEEDGEDDNIVMPPKRRTQKAVMKTFAGPPTDTDLDNFCMFILLMHYFS